MTLLLFLLWSISLLVLVFSQLVFQFRDYLPWNLLSKQIDIVVMHFDFVLYLFGNLSTLLNFYKVLLLDVLFSFPLDLEFYGYGLPLQFFVSLLNNCYGNYFWNYAYPLGSAMIFILGSSFGKLYFLSLVFCTGVSLWLLGSQLTNCVSK